MVAPPAAPPRLLGSRGCTWSSGEELVTLLSFAEAQPSMGGELQKRHAKNPNALRTAPAQPVGEGGHALLAAPRREPQAPCV